MAAIHGLETPPREKWKARAERAEGLLVQRDGLAKAVMLELEESTLALRKSNRLNDDLIVEIEKIPMLVRCIFSLFR